jgi:hypothetical protein
MQNCKRFTQRKDAGLIWQARIPGVCLRTAVCRFIIFDFDIEMARSIDMSLSRLGSPQGFLFCECFLKMVTPKHGDHKVNNPIIPQH